MLKDRIKSIKGAVLPKTPYIPLDHHLMSIEIHYLMTIDLHSITIVDVIYNLL